MRQHSKSNPTHFKEEYSVKFNYQKSDGFWEIKEETVYVLVNHNDGLKNKHKQAEDVIKNKYKKCKIINVKYC